jgi:hypothetical protein
VSDGPPVNGVVVNGSSVNPQINVTGDDWDAGSSVRVSVSDVGPDVQSPTPVVVGTFVVGADGTFEGDVTLPASATGTQHVEVLGFALAKASVNGFDVVYFVNTEESVQTDNDPTLGARLINDETNLVIWGANWDPGSRINLTMFSSPSSLGEFVIKADGTFEVTVPTPLEKEAGPHRIQGDGYNTKRPRTRNATVMLSSRPLAQQPSELALTGASTAERLAIAAGLLMLAGLVLVSTQRRPRQSQVSKR